MSAKLWKKEVVSVKVPYSVAVNGGAIGTIALGNLPDNFVVSEVVAHVKTALVGGGTFVVGEDGGGDADGYFTDMDAVALGVLKGTGALVASNAAHLVAAAKDGVQVTVAAAPYTAGEIDFYFLGFQA